jgi:hypothetical protein
MGELLKASDMSLRTLVIIVLIAAAAWLLYRRTDAGARSGARVTAGPSGGGDCARAAQRASDQLGGGIGRFVRPPLELPAWDSFRTEVAAAVGTAEGRCSCADEACTEGRVALANMRDLLAQLDRSARSGEPLSTNIVQQQSEIDAAIDRARELSSGR